MSNNLNAEGALQFDLASAVRTLIFPKLSLVYGQRLTLMYEGLQDAAVMADWVTELDGTSLEGITWALKNLPATDFPPNARQFRRLCCERPSSTQRKQVLPMRGRTVVPAFVKEISERIREEKYDREPRQVRNARNFMARVTATGHSPTHNERRWAAHWAQIIRQYERRDVDETDATKRKAAVGRAG